MRHLAGLLLVFLISCDSATEPERPAEGSYVLVAMSSEPPAISDVWMRVPVDYDVTGDQTCILRMTGGALEIDGNDYRLELSQERVACPDQWFTGGITYSWPPSIRQQGDLREIRGNDVSGRYALFEGDEWSGWVREAWSAGDTIYAELATPVGTGAVTYLRFEALP